ncbi:short-chain dehydrogenase [Luteitalea sp. TBR-22]|uniref:SDR family oxidoreductase n=1 Tax=Luteitalea sp. TBR-22 TaxID=2802971 RepID=UPI001AF4E835|nr:SDR family oxidoreductase [Luteitalea sp. TBR-22]BCS31881.1 short-chain dehydrogenase [Luteitalea sp. TBR-22]
MAVHISGTTALVTGANRGIGKALVEALLARGAVRVYATARRPESLEPLVAAGAGRVVAIALDVTRPEQVAAVADRAGDVTLLVNNAGVASHMFGAFDDPRWITAGREEFEVNVLGTLAVTQAFRPVLAAQGGGAVVNIASVGSFVGFPVALTYAAAKAGTHSLTQATRAMLRDQGTFVAGVYPGPTDTDMATRLPFEKTPPTAVAHAILDGLEAGVEDILPDPVARQMGAAYFSGPKQLEQQAVPA